MGLTRQLGSSSACWDSGRSWAPDCSVSSVTTPKVTATPKPVRPTPGPRRSLAPLGQEGRHRPLRTEQAAQRFPPDTGRSIDTRITRSQRLLPTDPSPRHRPPSSTTTTRNPAGSASSMAASKRPASRTKRSPGPRSTTAPLDFENLRCLPHSAGLWPAGCPALSSGTETRELVKP